MTMVLADTSVWVEHLHRGAAGLGSLLRKARVLGHPFIIGELACGNLKDRSSILGLLAALPAAKVAEDWEVMHIIDRHRLFGKGLGWVDAHLLASALLTGCGLWTRDKPLNEAAARLGLSPGAARL